MKPQLPDLYSVQGTHHRGTLPAKQSIVKLNRPHECSSGHASIKRALFLAILLVIASLSLGQAGNATPTTQLNVAGLVVDYGNGAVTYALVPFDTEELSGLDLLTFSGLDVFSIGVGGMGTAVCAIEQVGCDYDACRGRLCQTGDPDSPYWQYRLGTQEPGQAWRYSNRGVSNSQLSDGEVNGWFWSSHRPDTAAPTIEEIANTLGVELDDLRGRSSTAPLLLTVGSITPSNSQDIVNYWELIGGVAVFVGIGIAGWFASRPVRLHGPTR